MGVGVMVVVPVHPTGPVKLDCGRSSVANVNHPEKFARQTDPAVAADMGPRPAWSPPERDAS